jgi:hypothetical protein
VMNATRHRPNDHPSRRRSRVLAHGAASSADVLFFVVSTLERKSERGRHLLTSSWRRGKMPGGVSRSRGRARAPGFHWNGIEWKGLWPLVTTLVGRSTYAAMGADRGTYRFCIGGRGWGLRAERGAGPRPPPLRPPPYMSKPPGGSDVNELPSRRGGGWEAGLFRGKHVGAGNAVRRDADWKEGCRVCRLWGWADVPMSSRMAVMGMVVCSACWLEVWRRG